MVTSTQTEAKVERLRVSAFTVPTEDTECDETFYWDSVTMIAVEAEAEADGQVGLGYTYGDVSVGRLIRSKIVDVAEGADAMAVERVYEDMRGQLRNAGAKAEGAMVPSAVDNALWDLITRRRPPTATRRCGCCRRWASTPSRRTPAAAGWRDRGASRRSTSPISKDIARHKFIPMMADTSEPDTLLISDGFSCKHRLLELADRRMLHLAQVIKMALEQGPDGVPGPKPERAYPDNQV